MRKMLRWKFAVLVVDSVSAGMARAGAPRASRRGNSVSSEKRSDWPRSIQSPWAKDVISRASRPRLVRVSRFRDMPGFEPRQSALIFTKSTNGQAIWAKLPRMRALYVLSVRSYCTAQLGR